MEPLLAKSSTWMRAPQSGILRTMVKLGDKVTRKQTLGIVSDPFGETEQHVISTVDGIVIGRTNIPLVNEGEALFHVASFKRPEVIADKIEEFKNEMDPATDEYKPSEPPIL